jgi:hypothetical protein
MANPSLTQTVTAAFSAATALADVSSAQRTAHRPAGRRDLIRNCLDW